MKFKKTIALLLTIILAMGGTSLVAFAAADVDFTLRPDTTQTSEFAPGDTVNLYVDITTKTSNGYNNFTLEIGYNSDVLTYSDQAIDENGCTGNASGGVLTLTYNNPEGKNSAVNDVKHIKVAFTVLEGAPGGDTEFSSKVTCYGKDTTGTQKLRTCAPMLNKKITISDISNGAAANTVSPADYPVTSEILVDDIPSVYEREEEESKSGVGAGWVIILILLAFGGGFIAGYKLCEKRGGSGNRRDFTPRPVQDIPDEDDDELPTFSKRSPTRKPLQKENDDFDSSYFGRAREMGSGNDIFDKYSSDNDFGMGGQSSDQGMPGAEDDSGFPGSFFPRNYTSRAPQRNDDGFGSFGGDSGMGGGSFGNNDFGGTGSYGSYSGNDYGNYGGFGNSSYGSGNNSNDSYGGGYSSGSGFEDSDFGNFGGFGNGGFGGFEDDDNYRSRRR